MTKDTIPQDFTLGLAMFDTVPVVFFGIACWLLWRMTANPLLLLGGICCFLSGMLKVLWKVLVVIKKINVWPLFVQMRMGMPAGFLLILIGFVFSCFRKDMGAFWQAVRQPLPLLFMILMAAGMTAMIVCSSKLDSSDVKANWIEQSCNSIAQGAFLLAMLLTAIGAGAL